MNPCPTYKGNSCVHYNMSIVFEQLKSDHDMWKEAAIKLQKENDILKMKLSSFEMSQEDAQDMIRGIRRYAQALEQMF